MTPTAEEFIKNTELKQGFGFTFPYKIEEMMIEFAKLHVEAALKAAVNDAWGDNGVSVDEHSILYAYPKELIK